MNKDKLGDFCKFFETQETAKVCLPGLPIYARLDGRGFSKFTKKMKFTKPFDKKMCAAMINTMHAVVDEFDATVGYTQSDEISIGWTNENVIFGGKIQKLVSNLASFASVTFFKQFSFENDYTPTFDCRVFPVPSKKVLATQFLWRELDCTKNAITMAAQSKFSHKQLMNKNSTEKQEMMHSVGLNFNDYPAMFKRGTFCLRREILKEIPSEILEKIPLKNRPSEPVRRKCLIDISLPRLASIQNIESVLFEGQFPVIKESK